MNDHCTALVAVYQVIQKQKQPSTNSVEEFGHSVSGNVSSVKKRDHLLSQL